MSSRSAAEECSEISSKADEIEAHYNGSQKVAEEGMTMVQWMDPASYGSKAEYEQEMRNVINTTITNETFVQMKSLCDNVVSSSQSNNADNTMCPYCRENPMDCPYMDNVQVADNTQHAKCSMSSTLDFLMSQELNTGIMGAVKAVLKADGMGTESSADLDVCNVVNNDVSSKQFLESAQECYATLTSEQNNDITWCGPVIGNIQEAKSAQYSKCMQNANATVTTETVVDQSIETTTDVEVTAKKSGLMGMIIAIVIVLAIVGVVIAVINNVSEEDKDAMRERLKR